MNSNYFFVFRTDKWAETQLGTKWGDKWEEKFFSGIGSRQGETWHVSPADDRMSSLVFTFLYNHFIYLVLFLTTRYSSGSNPSSTLPHWGTLLGQGAETS